MQAIRGVMSFCERRRRALQLLLALATTAGLMVFSAFAGPLANLSFVESWEMRRVLIVVLLTPLAAVLGYAICSRDLKWLEFLFVYFALTCAYVLRTTVFNQVTPDHTAQRLFVEALAQDGLGAAAQGAGRYGLLGVYGYALISRIPFRELYMIKLSSILFDFALAFAAQALVERFVDRRRGTLAMLAVLYCPLTWLTGAYWAQWDALCALLCVLSLYALLSRHRTLCAVLFALAYAAGAEALFCLPLLLLWPHGGLRPRALAEALLTLLLCAIPLALAASPGTALAALSPARLFAFSQDQLAYCAPSLYQFVPAASMSYREQFGYLEFVPGVYTGEMNKWFTQETLDRLQAAGVWAAGIALGAGAWLAWRLRRHVPRSALWQALLLGALAVPMLLPGMSARSFFLPAFVSMCYALRYERRVRVCVLVAGATMLGYAPALTGQYVLPMTAAMAMNLLAAVQVICDLHANLAPGLRAAGAGAHARQRI